MNLLSVAFLATTAFAACQNDAEEENHAITTLLSEGFDDCEELIDYFEGSCATDLGTGAGTVKKCSPFCIGDAKPEEKGCCGKQKKFDEGVTVSEMCNMDCGGCTPAPTAVFDCSCTGHNDLIPETYPDFRYTGYGIYCNAWDLNFQYCNVTSPAYEPNHGNGAAESPPDLTPANNWCSQSWCYVQEGCSVLDRDWDTPDPPKVVGKESQTVVFKDPQTNKPVDLFYSYEQCGEFNAGDVEWPDFTGCEVTDGPLDVYVVMDGSSSIRDDMWANQLYFLQKLITEAIPRENDRFGLVQFSGKAPVVEFHLDANKDEFVSKIREIEQLKGGTKTDTGILKMLDDVSDDSLWDAPFDEENRERVFVLLTDGIPDPAENGPCERSNLENNQIPTRLKDGGWVSVVIAVGAQLQEITNRQYVACLVENPVVNIVLISDFEHFDEWRDPTGDLGLLCADPDNLQRSQAPTRSPTNLPSVDPTKEPSDAPTTAEPTDMPTPMPSGEPTEQPTPEPTQTDKPTEPPVECPAYKIPRPPILPCDDKEECKEANAEKKKECRRKKTKKRCDACAGCEWNKDKENCGAVAVDCDPCKQTPSNPVIKNNLPWGGTQSPDYWYNCIMHFCQKYTWMGGIDQCHYDPKYGCACESMTMEDCVADSECCWSGDETGCQEKVECQRLTFDECLEHSDKCAPCGNCGRCGYKCEMGPTQPPLPGFQSLILDEDCNCKVVQTF